MTQQDHHASPGKRQGLAKLNALLHSPGMRWVDWGTGLACLSIGLILLAIRGARDVDGWYWVAGGALGCAFAWLRPAQRLAERMNPVRQQTPRVNG